MTTPRKIALCALLAAIAAAGSIGVQSDALAGHRQPGDLYSYDTEFGSIKFYNHSGFWPVVKKIKHRGEWYRCSFWSAEYSCTLYRKAKNDSFHGRRGGY